MPQRSYLPDLRQTILRNFSPTDRFLVGVSGGRDSVALLDWLVQAGYRNLIVCHLNHQLRGRSSEADARFVEKIVANYRKRIVGEAPKFANGKRDACPTTAASQIDFVVGRANVRTLALKRKMSIETAAREARYDFFAKVANKKKCHAIILAHHADDLVETFLINLFRGAGNAGLGGIRELSKRHLDGVDLHVIRPLLGTWRADIDKFIRQNGLTFREDESNNELGPLRNRIRHRVIPYLEKNLGRGIRQNIWRTAMIVADEENFFAEQMPAIGASTDELSLQPLRQMGVAVQRRTLHAWLRAADVSDVGFELVERVRALLDVGNGAARTNLPRDRHVRRRAGKLILE